MKLDRFFSLYFIFIDYKCWYTNIIRGISSFLLGLWKHEYFGFFFKFRDSLFAVNKSPWFTSSLFTTVKRSLMFLWLKKTLVSSVNIIRSNKQGAFGRSFTYTRNRSGPRINLWRMSQVTYLRYA